MGMDAPTLRIRTTITLRNDKMLDARARAGMTQVELAEEACVPFASVAALEKLQWRDVGRDADEKARRIAAALGLRAEDILPPEGMRPDLPCKAWRVDEVSVDRMLAMSERLVLPAPDEQAMRDEERGSAASLAQSLLLALPPTARTVVSRYFGLDGEPPTTFKEIGKKVGLSPSRIHQVFNASMRHARQFAGRLERAAAAPGYTVWRKGWPGYSWHIVGQVASGQEALEKVESEIRQDETLRREVADYMVSSRDKILLATFRRRGLA